MKTLFIILCIVAILVPFIVWGTSIVKAIQFDANCIGYLRLSADANSVKLAEKHLSTAITYLEEHDLTHGNTKIIIYRPECDIGYWYENLKSAQTQLQELDAREDLTELEESNALMKLRETILNSGGWVTYPTHLVFYPSHVSWFWVNCLIWLLWILAFIFGWCASEQY